MTTLAAHYRAASGVKRALKDLIRSGLQTWLTTLNDEYADDVALTPIQAVYTSEKATLESYPAIELVVDGMTRGNIDQSVGEHRYRVAIFVTALSDDEERLCTLVERYVLALRLLCDSAGYLELVTGQAPLLLGDEDFSPVGTDRKNRGAFIKTGALEVSVPTFE